MDRYPRPRFAISFGRAQMEHLGMKSGWAVVCVLAAIGCGGDKEPKGTNGHGGGGDISESGGSDPGGIGGLSAGGDAASAGANSARGGAGGHGAAAGGG